MSYKVVLQWHTVRLFSCMSYKVVFFYNGTLYVSFPVCPIKFLLQWHTVRLFSCMSYKVVFFTMAHTVRLFSCMSYKVVFFYNGTLYVFSYKVVMAHCTLDAACRSVYSTGAIRNV